jgi:hypothetical protein
MKLDYEDAMRHIVVLLIITLATCGCSGGITEPEPENKVLVPASEVAYEYESREIMYIYGLTAEVGDKYIILSNSRRNIGRFLSWEATHEYLVEILMTEVG